ncbi:four-carbon acid sugar kinase family protein [Asanoa sp. NPDC050611]|uniref:four-carbon acid sugar kinase family protein n=1 Tax=Asanoa sp. NPDC050611 TaxID=3157098 RepID=UPI0033DC8F1D
MLTAVLDDDPTGTQSATGATVLLRWDTAAIVAALRDRPSVYLQTNSRALARPDAVALARRIRAELRAAAVALGRPVLPVLRGDSTLRGHVFAESDVFAGAGGCVLFVPAFPEGGRTTVGGVHRAEIDGVDTPVGETEFARDPVFGFRSSNLVGYVREKGDRRGIPVPLDALRASGGDAVAAALVSAGPGEFVVPDARTDADISLIHNGLGSALAARDDIVVRCAAPLAAICAGCRSTGYLERPVATSRPGIMVVCGSHTAAATAQLTALLDSLGATVVEVPTDAALADPEAAGRAAAAQVRHRLQTSGIAVLSTERVRRPEHDSLVHGEAVMRALAAAVAGAEAGTVVTKGGITSAEVARTALRATRARVRGQLAAGISVWDHDDGTVQVVVPGNVGGRETLVDAIDRLA